MDFSNIYSQKYQQPKKTDTFKALKEYPFRIFCPMELMGWKSFLTSVSLTDFSASPLIRYTLLFPLWTEKKKELKGKEGKKTLSIKKLYKIKFLFLTYWQNVNFSKSHFLTWEFINNYSHLLIPSHPPQMVKLYFLYTVNLRIYILNLKQNFYTAINTHIKHKIDFIIRVAIWYFYINWISF